MFNIVSKKNNNRFEAVFMSNHFVLCSTFAMSEPIFHYIERFHSTKEGLLAASNTTQPSLHFHRLTLPRCNYLVWLARITRFAHSFLSCRDVIDKCILVYFVLLFVCCCVSSEHRDIMDGCPDFGVARNYQHQYNTRTPLHRCLLPRTSKKKSSNENGHCHSDPHHRSYLGIRCQEKKSHRPSLSSSENVHCHSHPHHRSYLGRCQEKKSRRLQRRAYWCISRNDRTMASSSC
mmetsp:Transcript_9632/g.14696  ORF Transcript_9632/g.14696 Transcript_9632/m.14696 type:complete len:233 (+) Transcript_9632:524-1222(+)